jgi:glutamate-1-semialdehyde 2,1-aminomutase
VERGSMPAFAHTGEEHAAAAIASACGPLSSIIFTNSGSEAVHMACRVARVVTGRKTIAKMAAGFDGWFDAVALGNAGSPEALLGNGSRPERNDVTLLRFNDLADAERLFAERTDIAAIIVEPLLANAGCVEAASNYLAKLQDLARRNGTLLIADEVLMGFRMRYGLASHGLGFDPDIATLGKAIGNGFAVAALAGRPDILAVAADGRAVRAGTYSGNPVATAAVSASLQQLKARDYDRLEARGQRLRKHLVKALAERGIAASTSGLGMVFTPWFSSQAPVTYEMASACADQGQTMALHTALRRARVMKP